MKSALEKSDNTSSEFPAGMRVLIVDGYPESLHLLETMLKQCDYEGIYMHWSLVSFFFSPFFLFGCEENNGITNNHIRDPVSLASFVLVSNVCYFPTYIV